MTDSLFPVPDEKPGKPDKTDGGKAANTPETLGVTPRYLLQHNSISRGTGTDKNGKFPLSATARKLGAMAMSLLPPDLSSLKASFTFNDFCKALGYAKSGESFRLFKEAVRECMQCLIWMETEPDEKGRTSWKAYTWFVTSEFDKETGVATMEFSYKLYEFLAALKWMYAKISLKDMGQLQSRYAIHLFEMAISYRSLAGRGGNGGDEWYLQRGYPGETRQCMGVPDGTYKDSHVLKQKVIDNPIREINAAGIGLELRSEAIKQGRRTVAIRIYCKTASRKKPRGGTAAIEAKTAKPETPFPPPDPKAERERDEREDKELEHLRELYPDEYAERLRAAFEDLPPFMREAGMGEGHAAMRALLELRDRHGIVK
jgi:hypothetical protein